MIARYTLPEMGRLWDEEHKLRCWLKVEVAACEAMAELGEIPQQAVEIIKRKADFAYAYFWRGQAYYGKKRADKMVSDFETFLKLAPKSPEAPIVRQLLSSLG